MLFTNNNVVKENEKKGDTLISLMLIASKTALTVEKLRKIFKILYELATKIFAIFLILFHESAAQVREFLNVDPRKTNSLEGKVVLITGANSGIGECLAKNFYLAGCCLIMAARRRKELERVRDELLKLNGGHKKLYTPVILELDLSDVASIPKKVEEAFQAHGNRIDILINNAGIFNQGRALETLLEVDQRIMAVNYFGPLALTKAVANRMVERRQGQVVFVSSVLGKMTITNSLSYSASKHALQALADSLRAEVDDIAVTIVSPSYVKTDITKNALTSKGTQYGVVTNEIETGYSPHYVSERIFKAVVNKEADVLIAPLTHRGAIYLRNFFPYLFFFCIRLYGRRFN